ncbi:MAG: T9SS type A sorting domain-containing protein [Bacteroidales bacterium]|nr:T9SS type A sorting domain-containing protein [Bacteroidales bacterium]
MQGIILKTINSGTTWSVVFETDSDNYLTSINITGDENNTIYCCDYRSTRIFKSTDSGIIWEYLDILPNNGWVGLIQNTVTSLSSFSQDTCYFTITTTTSMVDPDVYGYQYVYKTINSFNSWEIQYVDSCFIGDGGVFKSLSDLLFINDTIGFAVGINKLIKTNNAGEAFIPTLNYINASDLQIYPNPFCDIINIKVLPNETIIKQIIYSQNGVVVFVNESNCESYIEIPSFLNRGLYLIQITTNNSVYYRKLIKI